MSVVTNMAGVTLYHGDCREILPDVSNAALLVTDPPYELTSGGNRTGEFGGKFDKSRYDNSGKLFQVPPFESWMALAHGCLNDIADAYIMGNHRSVFPLHAAAAATGFRFHNLLVWDKRKVIANRWYMLSCEFVLYLFKGAAVTINDPGTSQLSRLPHRDETDHPTEKPVGLLRRYIENSSRPGDLVIDPFMGSGSTGVAAVEAGRRFIGIEIDAGYFALAKRRIEAAGAVPSLFGGVAA